MFVCITSAKESQDSVAFCSAGILGSRSCVWVTGEPCKSVSPSPNPSHESENAWENNNNKNILNNFIQHRHTQKHILWNVSEAVLIVSWVLIVGASGLLIASKWIWRNSWMAAEARSLIGWTSFSRASASALRTRLHNFSISRRFDRNCCKEEKWKSVIHGFIQNLYVIFSFHTNLFK